jgi:hypothetical protein
LSLRGRREVSRCEGIRYGNVGAAGQLRSEADRTYARNSLGSGVGPALAAGNGDVRRVDAAFDFDVAGLG